MGNWERNPASNVISSSSNLAARGEEATASGVQILHGSNISDKLVSAQIKRIGNRCGHDKKMPFYYSAPSVHKRRPPILEKSKRALASLYFNPFGSSAGQMSYNPQKHNKRGGYRKLRSEVRDLVNNCVGECLLHYLDLKTLYVGMAIQGKFHYYSISFIHEKIKKSLLERGDDQKVITYERVRKAIKIFEDCGYLTIEEQKEMQVDGTYRSKPAKIRFNSVFFEDLGIGQDVIQKSLQIEDRRIASQAFKEKAKEYTQEKRKSKQIAKKNLRAINELLTIARAGGHLNNDEKELLDIEYPGITRKAPPTPPLYPEFISKILKRPPS